MVQVKFLALLHIPRSSERLTWTELCHWMLTFGTPFARRLSRRFLIRHDALAQQFRQPDLRIASRCFGRLRPTLAIALNMMQTSALTLGTWAAGKAASAACGDAWAAVCAKFGAKSDAMRPAAASLGAFADALVAKPSRLVHARGQHYIQPDGYGAARLRRRLIPL